MPNPTVSIVLPTWNGERDLERLLPALARQELPGGFELLAVDSSSSDRSQELLRAAGADLTVIDQRDFGHGRTRSARAASARGRFLVFLSQDVVPEGKQFLAELVAPFAEHPRAAGFCARILPHLDDDLLTARTALSLPEAKDEPALWDISDVAGLWELPAAERAQRLRFNNVASAVRADVFSRMPFPDVPFGEDFAWASRVLTAGWQLGFAPRAVVRHAHTYGPRAAFERYRMDAWFHRSTHGWCMRPSLASALRGLAFELREDLRLGRRLGLGANLAPLVRAPGLRGAQVLGQYLGSRGSAPRGWRDRPWTVPTR
ncbi:MAG: glycosyltransferase [Planctomycetaceae bacterium]|nr:glycosyltransferase [Planctomycetaceae bacterium]